LRRKKRNEGDEEVTKRSSALEDFTLDELEAMLQAQLGLAKSYTTRLQKHQMYKFIFSCFRRK